MTKILHYSLKFLFKCFPKSHIIMALIIVLSSNGLERIRYCKLLGIVSLQPMTEDS